MEHIIIGMGRCGTTSLSAYIKQHPEINETEIKEVHYFSIDDHYKKGDAYLDGHFKDRHGVTSTVDTYLLLSDEAPERIKKHNPNIKITVLLREPASRTYSNFHYGINNGYEKEDISFLDSKEKESSFLSADIILKNNLCHFEGSLYHKLLQNWLKYFPQEQIQLLKTSDLKNEPQKLMDELSDFLGVKRNQIESLDKQNVAKQVKSKSMQQFLLNRDHWLRKTVRVPLKVKFIKSIVLKSGVNNKLHSINKKDGEGYPPMTEDERNFCVAYFKEDQLKLMEQFAIEF